MLDAQAENGGSMCFGGLLLSMLTLCEEPCKGPSQKPQTRDPEGIQNTICTLAL